MKLIVFIVVTSFIVILLMKVIFEEDDKETKKSFAKIQDDLKTNLLNALKEEKEIKETLKMKDEGLARLIFEKAIRTLDDHFKLDYKFITQMHLHKILSGIRAEFNKNEEYKGRLDFAFIPISYDGFKKYDLKEATIYIAELIKTMLEGEEE